MTGLGAFIPDPVQSSHVIAHVSPLVKVYSPFTYNCEEENNEWHCPDIIVPEIKMKNDLKVPVNNFTTSQPAFVAVDKHLKTTIENPAVIPTLSNNQSLSESNWNRNKPEHISQHVFPNAYDNNQQNKFPLHQGPQAWSNPIHSQNPYTVQSSMPGSTNDYSTLGPSSYIPSSYSFPHRPPGPQFMSQHGFPPQPEMLNYPNRMDYPSMHHFPPQNLSHPGMFSAPQPDSNRSSYQYKADETLKLRKNKNMVNDNLILLSHNSSLRSDVALKGKKERNQSNLADDTFRDDKEKMLNDDPKDKLLRKVWKLRKSSEYDNVLNDIKGTKENKDKFYNKLNYAEMLEDTQIDTVHDYQFTNLRERIETCLAEGKSSPGHSRHRDRREGDRENKRHKDRCRDKVRDGEFPRRGGSMEGERKRHDRSPLGDERKKRRSVEGRANHEHSRKSKEPSDKKGHSKTSNRDDVIEILSDEDHNKHKLSDSCTKEGSVDPDDHLKPSEKTLLSLIFDSLGPEIRKIQEKSDLYKSIIDTLDKGDKAYKRLYSFRNHALMKSDKDNRMKMVIPRDNLKEVVILIHKSFHHVQGEELSRLLKNISYPYMLYIPKFVSKVMSECSMCIEEKKKNDETMIDQKSEKTERKPEKRNNRSLKDKDRDRRNSTERYKRISKDKSLSSSSKGRRDSLRSGREKDKKDSSTSDGRPSGYEKATKIRRPGVSSCTISNKVSPDYRCLEEKSNLQIDVKSSELLDGLNDKALEFKQMYDGINDVSEGRSSIPERFNPLLVSGLDKNDNENISSACCEVGKNDSEDKELGPEIESSDLVTKPEMRSSDIVTKQEMESSDLNTKPEMISSDTVTKPETESFSTVTKSEMESLNTLQKTEREPCNAVTKPELEPLNIIKKSEMESPNTVTKIEMKSSDQVTDPQKAKELINPISESSYSLKASSVDTNQNQNESYLNTRFEGSNKQSIDIKQNNNHSEESKRNNFKEKEASLDQKVNDDSKAVPKLDFKGRVRQVQMSSNECKNVMRALELKDGTIAADPSYLIKGGMLCRKDATGNTIEVKIVVPGDELEKVVNIVHTMSAVHTPPVKVVAFFSKHFTPVENLDLKVDEIVSNCSYCKLKSS